MAVFETEIYENKTDEWATPRDVVMPLSRAVGGFDLDPASGAENSPHADEVYTEEDDGLHQPWFGNIWCNPPYSDKDAWLERALRQRGNYDTLIMLLPVDTSTGWFHNYVTEADAICFVNGRISFGDYDGTPNFAQMFVVFGDVPDELLEVLESRGAVFNSPWAMFEQATLGEHSDT